MLIEGLLQVFLPVGSILNCSFPLQVALLDKLREICPEQLTRFFFCNSGSEAVENAIKIARGHTKKQNIIAFEVFAGPGSYIARLLSFAHLLLCSTGPTALTSA